MIFINDFRKTTLSPAYTNNEIYSEKNHETYTYFQPSTLRKIAPPNYYFRFISIAGSTSFLPSPFYKRSFSIIRVGPSVRNG